MKPMDLQTLLSYLPIKKVLHHGNPMITSIENNHQHVKNGSLFVCITGAHFDGHNFAEEAVKKGAVALLAEKDVKVTVPTIIVKDTKKALALLADIFYGQPTHKLRLIGVTGTNGKTTTTQIIDHLFQQAGEKTGLIGTMYMKIGDRKIETKNTTPDSLTLQKTFKAMVDDKVTTAVMEVSSHALVQGRVHGCDYDIAIFTNLTQDHLDYHGTMDEYRRAKGLLFAQLGNTFHHNRPKYAIMNSDDPASAEFMIETAGAHVVTYGIEKEADFRATDIQLHPTGTRFLLHYPEGTATVNMKLVGKFNVYNVLAAVAAAYVSGMEIHTILQGIQSLTGVAGRFEVVDGGQNFSVIVDYAHTPDSLENVLKTVKQLTDKRIFVVVGCGGDRDKTKRPIMARIACQYADIPVFTSDNPRSEDPMQILRDMEQGAEGQAYQLIPDRKQAIFWAIEEANQGDVVLIAGKGHETYQIIGDQVLDFDDRQVALEAIKGRL
jgi:UDP-N-acetylmuramoyl-L-alanyl-D-glutamate--2,6-diaminopimelate ligase